MPGRRAASSRPGALSAALSHGRAVTEPIRATCAAAHQAWDFRTMQLSDWFVKEQGEEDASARTLVRKLEPFGSKPKGLRAPTFLL